MDFLKTIISQERGVVGSLPYDERFNWCVRIRVHSVEPNAYWCVHVSCLFGFIARSDDRHPAWEPPTQTTWGFERIVKLYTQCIEGWKGFNTRVWLINNSLFRKIFLQLDRQHTCDRLSSSYEMYPRHTHTSQVALKQLNVWISLQKTDRRY